ncbi:MAG TPA: lycopene beta-cyclase CrtY [Hyphomicrobiales bacterium]|nr:lycopene beta-cyclase CrtY [Hyphomicrobiales bacterium]
MSNGSFDVIIAGGGLAGTLLACRLRQRRPDLRLLLIESGCRLGGNHTWSFHDTDIAPPAREWIAPFITHRWECQQVRFPKYRRTMRLGYNSVTSDTLHEAASKLLEGCISYETRIAALEPFVARVENGEALHASCVIDARGEKGLEGLILGFQKFLGIAVRLRQPHGQSYPIIMDATVAQRDGYRFVYTLPFTGDEILIEDTYYSATPDLDTALLRNLCQEYAEERGWAVAEIVKEESGILPVVLAGDGNSLLKGQVPRLGVRGGFFHHTTSYSFPFAVRCADAVAGLSALTSGEVKRCVDAWARSHWKEQRFFRALNRMLFWAASPDRRYRILERFYELPEPLIARFYGGNLTLADRARILMGWPPVPVEKALRAMAGSAGRDGDPAFLAR